MTGKVHRVAAPGTALAACAARPDLALVSLHPEDAPRRLVYAATPRGLAPSPAVAAFLALLRETAAGLASWDA
ncbi:hypothetical protein ACFWBF_23080 [Streptomyces sp. NPDC060028]|uniref:hypothetical protein n=1 Tax=Streptomyces sp. NPDC060028 TaxID=3347041 RepID=UPI003677C071